MQVNLNFVIPDPLALLAYIVIGTLVTLLIGALFRLRRPSIYIISVLMAAFGAWLFVSVIKIQVNDGANISLLGVPLIEAAIGAVVFSLLTIVAMLRTRRTYA